MRLLCIGLLFFSIVAVRADDPLTVEVKGATFGAKVKVQISNSSSVSAFVWKNSNSWGWSNWTFEFLNGNQLTVFVRKPDEDFTRNFPVRCEIPAKGSREMSFDLKDGTWISHKIPIFPTYPVKTSEEKATVGCFALLSVPFSAEMNKYNVRSFTAISPFH
jgi:hypothetical protein